MNTKPIVPILLLALIGATACQPTGPEAIQFGQDQCVYCRMTIADPKFGAELITDKGRVLKYDAIECLVHHLAEDAPPHRDLFAVAYDKPRELQPVESLVYVIAPAFKSPMGANLAGFTRSSPELTALRDSVLTWEALTKTLTK